MKTIEEIAEGFAAALRVHDIKTAESYWSDDVVSIEAVGAGPMPAETRGREAVAEKGAWFYNAFDFHDRVITGPFYNGDTFHLYMDLNFSLKGQDNRKQSQQVAAYTVKDGEIVEERFFASAATIASLTGGEKP